jgi:hypothetical protein
MAVPTKTYSVQPRFLGRDIVQPATGWGWVDWLLRTYRQSHLPPYGSWQRDVYLAEVWKIEPILAGIFNAFMERCQTRQWKITGGRNNAMRAARMLNDSEGGNGFSYLVALGAGDFMFTDKGWFLEKGRKRKGATIGPVLSLQQLDSTRMVRDYSQKGQQRRATWHYLPEKGEAIPIPDDNMIRIIPTPSGRDRYRGIGYCAASRLYDALEMMLGFLIYYRQKIGNLPPQLIAIINGMGMEQFKNAKSAYETGRRQDDSDIYPGIFFLGSNDPSNPLSITTTQFAGLPDGFDWFAFAEWWVKVIALNVGEASGDYWLLQHAGIGQAGYAVQAQMARGRGSGRFVYETEYRLNIEVMPFGTRFSFDAPDDEQDQESADILATNMTTIERMAKAGAERGEFIYTIEEIRAKSVELDILDPETAGMDVPAEFGAILKRYAGVGEPQVHILSDYSTIEIQPLITGKTADAARNLYHILEGYYAPYVATRLASGNGTGRSAPPLPAEAGDAADPAQFLAVGEPDAGL